MSKACPLPTPAERVYGEIRSRIETAMIRKIDAALQEATEQAQAEMKAAGLEMEPPSRHDFTAKLHQRLYCTLCGANPDTFEGGRPDTALFVIKNSQNIARHYWGAKIEPDLPSR